MSPPLAAASSPESPVELLEPPCPGQPQREPLEPLRLSRLQPQPPEAALALQASAPAAGGCVALSVLLPARLHEFHLAVRQSSVLQSPLFLAFRLARKVSQPPSGKSLLSASSSFLQAFCLARKVSQPPSGKSLLSWTRLMLTTG